MIVAYKIALDPNNVQETYFSQGPGCGGVFSPMVSRCPIGESPGGGAPMSSSDLEQLRHTRLAIMADCIFTNDSADILHNQRDLRSTELS